MRREIEQAVELVLRDGDYVCDGRGGMERAEGAEEILARVLFRLTARRGALPFLPELGSDLHRILREKPSARLAAARQYVAQALAEEDVRVTDVTLNQTPAGAEVTVYLLWQGQELTVRADVEGA